MLRHSCQAQLTYFSSWSSSSSGSHSFMRMGTRFFTHGIRKMKQVFYAWCIVMQMYTHTCRIPCCTQTPNYTLYSICSSIFKLVFPQVQLSGMLVRWSHRLAHSHPMSIFSSVLSYCIEIDTLENQPTPGKRAPTSFRWPDTQFTFFYSAVLIHCCTQLSPLSLWQLI